MTLLRPGVVKQYKKTLKLRAAFVAHLHNVESVKVNYKPDTDEFLSTEFLSWFEINEYDVTLPVQIELHRNYSRDIFL